MFGFCILQAGFAPVYKALVYKPLFGYRTSFGTEWGSLLLLKPEFMADWFPTVLRVLPAVGVVMLALAGWLGMRRDWTRARHCVVIAAVGAMAMASIAYYPDLIHYAYVVGVFFVGAALLTEWGLRRLPSRAAGLLAPAAAAAGIAYFGLHLQGVAARAAARHPHRLQTRFGTIATEPRDLHATMYPVLQPLIDADPERLLFTAPAFASLYLLADANNPTPYQFVVADYTDAAEFDRIFAALEARQARHVVITWWPEQAIEPRLREYVLREYEAAVPEPPLSILLLRRRTPAPAAPDPRP